ncbi:MAG: 6-carboxytetrahydropterin synthase [Fimbriimonadaceae bacterium]
MKLTRRVTFSAGHRFWMANLSPEENRQIFGPWASPFNHGHNYILDVTTQGEVDPKTGMVINIKEIDEVLQRDIVSQFAQRSMNDEIPHFASVTPCLENLLLYLRTELLGLPQQVTLTHIRLEETPTIWADLNVITNKMTFSRSYEFAAAHRLHCAELSDEKNAELFGKCNNAAGHGHNYVLEVSVTGTPDPQTGFIIDMSELDASVNRNILERYDHKNLNVDLPEFEGRMTTTETLAQEIWKRLDGAVPGQLERICIHETARSRFEVCRGD